MKYIGKSTCNGAVVHITTDCRTDGDIYLIPSDAIPPGTRVEISTDETRVPDGIVVAVYFTTRGKLRYVVEVEPQGFQMIVVPEKIRRRL